MAGYAGPARDFALEVRSHGDHFTPWQPPHADAVGLVLGDRVELTLGGLVQTAAELAARLGIAFGDRILVDERTAEEAGPVAWLLAPCRPGPRWSCAVQWTRTACSTARRPSASPPRWACGSTASASWGAAPRWSAGRDSALQETQRLLQQAPCDHHALHLVGALVDLGDLGVAHHPLDREVLRVAAPPNSWTASVVTCMATSEAKAFAEAETRVTSGRPARRPRRRRRPGAGRPRSSSPCRRA